jgi:hypothetical protein
LSKSPPNRRQGHPPTGRGLVTTHPRDGCVATSKKVCLSGVNERILDKLPGKDLLRPCTHNRERCVRSSGDLVPPSPPAEKATAREDQAGQTGTGDGAGNAHAATRDSVVPFRSAAHRSLSATCILLGPANNGTLMRCLRKTISQKCAARLCLSLASAKA